jgi:hypothetical protein
MYRCAAVNVLGNDAKDTKHAVRPRAVEFSVGFARSYRDPRFDALDALGGGSLDRRLRI